MILQLLFEIYLFRLHSVFRPLLLLLLLLLLLVVVVVVVVVAVVVVIVLLISYEANSLLLIEVAFEN